MAHRPRTRMITAPRNNASQRGSQWNQICCSPMRGILCVAAVANSCVRGRMCLCLRACVVACVLACTLSLWCGAKGLNANEQSNSFGCSRAAPGNSTLKVYTRGTDYCCNSLIRSAAIIALVAHRRRTPPPNNEVRRARFVRTRSIFQYDGNDYIATF